jgi:hypothetical protein
VYTDRASSIMCIGLSAVIPFEPGGRVLQNLVLQSCQQRPLDIYIFKIPVISKTSVSVM